MATKPSECCTDCLPQDSYLILNLYSILNLPSEQKRRLKAQKKAEEKAAKQAEQAQQAPAKATASAESSTPKVSDDDLDPTVSFLFNFTVIVWLVGVLVQN